MVEGGRVRDARGGRLRLRLLLLQDALPGGLLLRRVLLLLLLLLLLPGEEVARVGAQP